MCEGSGRFLFDLLPDLLPEGYLTETELHLWALHYQWKAKQNR